MHVCMKFIEFLVKEDSVTIPEDGERFPEIDKFIASCLKTYNGSVMPKLSWSAPRDALWIIGSGRLKCRNREDVYSLLKSSSAIAHDILDAPRLCVDHSSEMDASAINHVLTLRSFMDSWDQRKEYRCFVRDAGVIALCRRYPVPSQVALAEEDIGRLKERIWSFFHATINGKLPLDNCIVDVLVSCKKIVVVDVAPMTSNVDPIRFEWDALLSLSKPKQSSDIEFLDHVAAEGQIHQGFGYVSSIPEDFTTLAGDSMSMYELVKALERARKEQHCHDDDGEEQETSD
eukprot:TRINITY_DN1213_c0_g1_i2.p1 TRINITY_DN1213_c0_g1~~TRINITY_DN1213_c0_g1_i2.p1  ORF type:complete len:288 (-),score=85.65 TRINITY_DN1213_c0_g1_i2:104-967(-)